MKTFLEYIKARTPMDNDIVHVFGYGTMKRSTALGQLKIKLIELKKTTQRILEKVVPELKPLSQEAINKINEMMSHLEYLDDEDFASLKYIFSKLSEKYKKILTAIQSNITDMRAWSNMSSIEHLIVGTPAPPEDFALKKQFPHGRPAMVSEIDLAKAFFEAYKKNAMTPADKPNIG